MTQSIFEPVVLTDKHDDFLKLVTSDEYLDEVKRAKELRKERQKDSIVNKPISQKLKDMLSHKASNEQHAS